MNNENTAPNAQAFEDFARDLDLEVKWLGEGYSDCNTDYAWLAWNAALASKQVANTDTVRDLWQPIETAPQDGYMLVHEDAAIRAMLRVGSEWKQIGYPAIISHPFGDSIVGKDAERMLPAGYRLELRDGCCENPTHWMPLPSPPAPQPENKP